nr:alpha/beta hydrolase [Companilactobacillus halodurans]
MDQKQTIWEQTLPNGLKIRARFLPADDKSFKTVIVVHGFGSSSKYMGSYVRMFHDAGYNVLTPDLRSFGLSQGQYSGYGFQDRPDMVNWIKLINQKFGNKSEIGLYGISMGASTVMYALEKPLPNVKFAIADCGYSSISGELSYQLKDMFHLPSFPIIPTTSLLSKLLADYNFYQADTKKFLKNNLVPLYIIHGAEDKFVPTKNAYQNFNYNKGPKKLWIVKHAGHAGSLTQSRQTYIDNVTAFAKKYFSN